MHNDTSIANIFPVPNLYGIVVCGGSSKRMGMDKSMLQYHHKPQRYHLYEMLKPICEKVFISCNASQSPEISDDYQVLTDLPTCSNIGPMAALVTAIIHYPNNDFLLIGCDYPFLTTEELYSFVIENQDDMPAAFYNEMEQVYEPLLARYHHSSHHQLMKMYATGQYSLQQFLKHEPAAKYHPSNKRCIQSVDTRHDYQHARKQINLRPEW